jgi:hypothetical protein
MLCKEKGRLLKPKTIDQVIQFFQCGHFIVKPGSLLTPEGYDALANALNHADENFFSNLEQDLKNRLAILLYRAIRELPDQALPAIVRTYMAEELDGNIMARLVTHNVGGAEFFEEFLFKAWMSCRRPSLGEVFATANLGLVPTANTGELAGLEPQQLVNKQADHRMLIEKKIVEAQIRQSDRGQWMALVTSILAIAASVFVTIQGHEAVGGILGGGTVVSLAGVFIAGKLIQKSNFAEQPTQREPQTRKRSSPKGT